MKDKVKLIAEIAGFFVATSTVLLLVLGYFIAGTKV